MEQQTCKGIAIGDRVSVDFWGTRLQGVVEKVGRTMGGVVWVRMDLSKRVLWFHRESISVSGASITPEAR